MPKGVYKRIKGAPRLGARKPKREVICNNCQATVLVAPSNIRRRYCNTTCYLAHNQGITHPRYNESGSTTGLGYQLMRIGGGSKGRQFLHRLIAEKVLGRKLLQC